MLRTILVLINQNYSFDLAKVVKILFPSRIECHIYCLDSTVFAQLIVVIF